MMVDQCVIVHSLSMLFSTIRLQCICRRLSDVLENKYSLSLQLHQEEMTSLSNMSTNYGSSSF